MAASARIGHSGRVAVLTLACASNGATAEDGVSPLEALRTALAAPRTDALVLCGPAEAFAAAAAPALCDALAAAPVPVVAACAGALEDGAVELALGAAYRLAAPATTFAFPGIGAGRLPSADAVQRLVRQAGSAGAAALLLHPRPLAAPEAERIGLVDGVARGALEAACLSLARRLAGAALGPRAGAPPGRDRAPAALAPDPGLACRAPGAVAALQACLAAAAGPPGPPGPASRAAADALAAYGGSAEAVALSRLARARAAVAPPPGAPEPVERVAVSGLAATPDTLAPAFVDALARAGVDVRLADPLDELDAVRRALPDGAAGRIRAAGPGAERADLALDCTGPEIRARFASGVQLELTLAGPGPGAALVEAVPGRAGPSGASGESGAAAALRAMAELCRRAGAVHVGHAPGAAPFAPILRGALFEAAHLLLEDGWTPGALDAAAVAAGLPAGPCAQEDALGLGVGARARAAAAAWRDPRRRYAAVADRLHGAGRTGRRAGAGFHRYAGAFDLPQRDPAADALLADARREAGRARRTDLSAEAACQALLRAVAQAARLCVAGGTAGDVVDLVAVEAGAFPARLGGPLACGGSGGAGAAGALSRAGPRR